MATRRKKAAASTNTPKLNAERVKLDRGGYVRSGQAHAGRYFGVGEKLWRVTDDDQLDEYVRASSAKAAKAVVLSNALRMLARIAATKPNLGSDR
jgi:hypothetical protein